MADGLYFINQPRNSGALAVILIVYYLYITRDDFAASKVVLMKSRRAFWIRQLKENALVGFGFIIIIISISVIAAYLAFKGEIINWNKQYSTFAIMNNGVISNATYGEVLIKTMLDKYLQTLLCLVITQLVIWITGKRILGLLLTVMAAISDIHPNYVSLYFSRFYMSGHKWAGMSISTFDVIIKLGLLCVVVMTLGYIYSKYKEFYN